jgi:hypothetical protein
MTTGTELCEPKGRSRGEEMSGRTSSGKDEDSRSGVIVTLCTKNLSRHFVPGGGSSFIGCSRTVGEAITISIVSGAFGRD